jgi:glutamine amidotransferase
VCRIFGCVAAEPVSLRHELLDAPNPLIRQSEHHDSGWGMAVYERGEGAEPTLIRIPEAAHADHDFARATEATGRIFNVHVRRATVGGLTMENTHPFTMGSLSFGHNGTVIDYPLLGVTDAEGETDSEHMFRYLVAHFDSRDTVGSLRKMVAAACEVSVFSGLNFLFCDGFRLYAYRFGLFDLFWVSRPGQLIVSSEKVTEDEDWHTVEQDVLLVLEPGSRLGEPHAERLLGDELAATARLDPLNQGAELTGEDRGRFAAERAQRIAPERRPGAGRPSTAARSDLAAGG